MSITSSETWLTPDASSGYSNATITLTAAGNSSNLSRTSKVTVSGGGLPDQIITITQNGLTTKVELPETSNILVYPNPVNDILNISIPDISKMQDCYLRVMTITGKTILEIKADQPEYKLNVAGWPGKGVYILQIRDANKINKIVRKLILR